MVRAEAAFSLSQAIITRERPSSRHTSSAAASMRVDVYKRQVHFLLDEVADGLHLGGVVVVGVHEEQLVAILGGEGVLIVEGVGGCLLYTSRCV